MCNWTILGLAVESNDALSEDLLDLLCLDWDWLLILDNNWGLGWNNIDWWSDNLRLLDDDRLRNGSLNKIHLGRLLLDRNNLRWVNL